MMEITLEHTERAECEAFLALYECAPREVREQLGLAAAHIGPMYVFRMRAIDSLLFNRTVWLDPAPAADILPAVLAWYRDGGGRRFQLQLGGADVPDAIVAMVHDAGGVETDAPWAKFAALTADVARNDIAGLEITAVGAADRAAWARMTRTAFAMPPLFEVWLEAFSRLDAASAWLGRQDGQPAAGGVLYGHGETGWLGLGCTLAAHRGRGWQRRWRGRRAHDRRGRGHGLRRGMRDGLRRD